MSVATLESPYRGLRPFEDSEADALLFFGREHETDVIAANLVAARLTVLYGPSGVGKSSVLRAGVMHSLRRGGDAVVRFESWSGDPVEGIAAAVRAEVSARLGDEVPDPGGSLLDRLGTWSELLGLELYLVLDQIEEYFLYHGRNGKPDALLAELPEVVNAPGLRVNVLVGIREDALALLDAFKARIPQVLGNYLRLDRLDRSAAEAAILGPLAAWSELTGEEVAAEPELVETLLDEVSVEGGRIEAPYLQVVLERVWDAERAAGSSLLRRSTLARLGGSQRIVDDHLERALAGLGAVERDTAAAMFAHLVTPGGTKIAHELHDLASYAGTDVRPVASALVAERILRPVDGGSNGGRVEIYHDVLAASVADWRRRHETDRQLARERRQQRKLAAIVGVLVLGLALMTALAAYAFSQRSEAQEQAALAAERTAEAEASQRYAEDSEAKAQQALVEKEQEAERAREATDKAEAALARERGLKADLAATNDELEEQRDAAQSANTALASTNDQLEAERDQLRQTRDALRSTNSNLIRQRRQANTQRRRAESQALANRVGRLTAQSRALLTVDPAQSLDLAVRAARLEPGTPRVEDALFAALRELRVLAVLDAGGKGVRGVAFSDDGRLALTAADGGSAKVFDVRTGAVRQHWPHGTVVSSVAFSTDTRRVVTGARDNRARIWSVETGTLLHTLAHGGPVVDVAYSRDGRYVVTASADKHLRIWDAGSGLLLHDEAHPDSLRDLVLSPDGSLVVTLTGDRFARVFRVADGSLVARPEMAGEVTSAAFSPAGDLLATTGRRNVGLWETSDWARRHLLLGHEGITVIRAASFSPDGKTIAVAAGDGSARTWDVATGEALKMQTGHAHGLTAITWHPDGSSFATSSLDRTVRIWTGPVGQAPFTLVGHTEAVRDVAFAPDGTRMLTGGDDGKARLWQTPAEPRLVEVGRHGREAVTAAAFSPDGTMVLSTGLDGTARLTRLAGGATRTLAHGSPVVTGAFARGGQIVATAAQNGIARIWRTRDGAPLRAFEHGTTIAAAGVDPAGRWIATAGADRSIKLWAAGTGRLRWARSSTAPVRALAVSRDGSLLAAGEERGYVRVYRTSDGSLVRSLFANGYAVVALGFSPDGKRLATGGDDGVGRIWTLTDGKARALEGHTNGITTALFSPDGRVVLTASLDGFGRIWDTRTGALRRTLSGHVAVIAQAAFSPDGRWIVTAGPGAAGIWSVRTGERLPFLRGHEGALRAAAFSPDGRRVVTGGIDGTVRTYRCTLCEPVAQLLRRAEARLRALNRASAASRGR